MYFQFPQNDADMRKRDHWNSKHVVKHIAIYIYTRPKKFLKSELFKKYLNHPTTQALFIDIIVMLYVSVISVHQIWDGIVPHEWVSWPNVCGGWEKNINDVHSL